MSEEIKIGRAYKDVVDDEHYYYQQADQVLHVNTNGTINNLPKCYIIESEKILVEITTHQLMVALMKVMAQLGLKTIFIGKPKSGND